MSNCIRCDEQIKFVAPNNHGLCQDCLFKLDLKDIFNDRDQDIK